MAPGRTRNERKEQQWQRWIAQWRASGLSVRAFCDRYGLATPSFYAWRRDLQQRDRREGGFRGGAGRGQPAPGPMRRPGGGAGRWPGRAGRPRV